MTEDRAVVHGPRCDVPVVRAAMVHWWEELTFIHWRFDPAEVQRLLPPGLTVETFDGSAWVGLVPFFLRVGLPRVRSIPWFSRFAETNVRTYARSRDGTSGVWFFSLDAARLGAVVTARCTYRLPYFWSKMSIEHSESTISYRATRRWPRPEGSTTATVEIGKPFDPPELTELDHFLTARWALFSAHRAGLHQARAFHDPWPLHHARLVDLDDSLVEAAGLSAPDGAPLVHYAPSVQVRIGWPTRVSHLA
ncbi:MAG: DUF2071 domain-containing protein [Ilumatobacteraceae bacterium]